MSGGLFDPLGTDRAEPARPAGRTSAPVIVAALVVGALAALVSLSWLRDDGGRGQPVAVAPIERIEAPPKPPATPAPPPAAPAASPLPAVTTGLPPTRDDQEVEVQNGVRIVRPRRDPPAKGGLTLTVPGAAPDH